MNVKMDSKKMRITAPKNEHRRSITSSEFFSGLISSMVINKELHSNDTFYCDENFYKAVEKIYKQFSKAVLENGHELLFTIKLDPTYSDSETIETGLTTSARRNYIGFDNPTFQRFRLKLDKATAEEIIKHLPGGEEIFKDLGNQLYKEINSYTKTADCA